MATRGRSATPGRRYGDIIGSIFSNSGDEDDTKDSCGSEAKRRFRERRRKSSPGTCLNRNSTPERRQNPSPVRPPSGRPPTPDRNRSRTPDYRHARSQSPSHAQNGILSSQMDPFENKGKGISIRALSKSPSRRRVSELDTIGTISYVTNPYETREGTEDIENSFFESRQQKSDQISSKENETEKKNVSASTTEPLVVTKEEDTKTTVSFSSNDSAQMKKIIQAQDEQLHFYESRLRDQTNHIEQIRFELQQSKQNEKKLQLELEFHDLRYSMYDDYRRMMDRRRLDGRNDDEGDDLDWDSASSNSSKNGVAMSKLDRLERLYEKSQAEATSRYSSLEEEYNRLVSESSQATREKASDVSEFTRTESVEKSSLLEKRIKILESDNAKYLNEIKRKQRELDDVRLHQDNAIPSSGKEKQNTIQTDRLETQTLKNKITALETEIGFTSGQIDNRTRTSRYRALEKNLNEYVVEIMGLEDKLRSKEKIISRLKKRELSQKAESESGTSLKKWYERVDKGGKTQIASTHSMRRGKRSSSDRSYNPDCTSAQTIEPAKNDIAKTSDASKSLVGENIDVVSTYINTNIGGNRRMRNKNGASSSSARIAMLRKRLDALATDHSSVCTDETFYTVKTTPYF